MQVLMPAYWVIHGEVGKRSLGFWDGTGFGPLENAKRYPDSPAAGLDEAGEVAWDKYRRDDEGSTGITPLLFIE